MKDLGSIKRDSAVFPWVIAVYLGVSTVMAAMSVLSEAPLEMEGGPLGFLDAFLVFVLAGLLLVLGTYGEWRTPLRSGYLLGTVLALGVGIIQLVGLLDGETPIVEELDTGDTLCWLIAGGFLVWMIRAAQQVRAAERFLILGFVLQSFSLVADVTDGMFVELPDLFDWLFGPGEEISEVLFLVSYCCGFALLINRSAAEGLRWRRAGLRAHDMLEPVTVIKRAFLAVRWRRRGLVDRLTTALQVLAAPVRFGGELAWQLTQNGRRVRRDFGKGTLRQFIEAIVVGVSAGANPASYYRFDLFMTCNRKLARHYLHRQEFGGRQGINRLLRRLPGARSPLSDRFEFAAHCAKHDLPTAPVLAHGSSGKLLVLTEDGALPPMDLVARPNKGGNAHLIEHWRWTGDAYCGPDGSKVSQALLLERIARSGIYGGMLLQPWRRNHPALSDLACGAAVTVRIITCLDENERPEITHAMLLMARDERPGSHDFWAGGVAASVELMQGRLGWATDPGFGDSVGWIGLHPHSGAAITGRVLPFWREIVALALRAHRACLDRTVVGWDIAILPDGVELLGADPAPDLELVQRIHSRPLGLDRLGRLIAFHVRDSLR